MSRSFKRRYYENLRVARDYMKNRYSGKSGRYVNLKELDIVKKFLPESGLVLDIPCGPGRLAEFLLERKHGTLVGADFSTEMLRNSFPIYKGKVVRSDAFNLPFRDGVFTLVVSLRFVFHYPDVFKFFQEVKRVLKPGGVFIFETYRWSPLILNIKKFGGRVYIHSRKKIQRYAKILNMEIIDCSASFIFSPYICSKLPYFALMFLDELEKFVPQKCRYAVSWVLRKNE